MKKINLSTVASILLIAAVFIILYRHSGFVASILTKSGPWAPLVAVVLYPLLAPTPITTDPITIILGISYGPFIGMIMGIVGNTLATLVEYYLGGRIGKSINFEEKKDILPFGLGKLPISSPYFLVFGRMIPGYGSKIISLLAGQYKVPIKLYLWTSLVSNIWGSATLAYGGSGFLNILRGIFH